MTSEHRRRLIVLGLFALALVVITFAFVPPIPQDRDYLNFVDTRGLFEIPNFWNVISNLPFLFFGVVGAVEVFRSKAAFGLPVEKWPYQVFFVTLFLTGLGSGYFHADVNTETLFWDRLPISLSFMALVAAMIGDRVNAKAGAVVLAPFLLIGASSVIVWLLGERQGAGDLRFYALVQFGSIPLLMALMFMLPSRYTQEKYIWIAMGCYVIAKLCEVEDRRIFETLGFWSGHTIKHFAAAAASGAIWWMIRKRKEVGARGGT